MRPSNHLILCHPSLLLPFIFSHVRVFSNESALCIRWPKCWSSRWAATKRQSMWSHAVLTADNEPCQRPLLPHTLPCNHYSRAMISSSHAAPSCPRQSYFRLKGFGPILQSSWTTVLSSQHSMAMLPSTASAWFRPFVNLVGRAEEGYEVPENIRLSGQLSPGHKTPQTAKDHSTNK